VFFSQAVQRIQNKLGPCTFLEAGSDSSIISMVRRALSRSLSVPHNFVPMELNKTTSLENLADTTVNLWNCGHRVQFWNFHQLQVLDYNVLQLPAYQFEKPKHWLKLDVAAPGKALGSDNDAKVVSLAPALIRFKGTDLRGHYFNVDPRCEEYKLLVKGHVILGEVECSMSLYVELVSRAVKAI